MSTPLELHEDRLFPAEPGIRALARELYANVADLPIISPHGHTDPAWFAHDEPFGNATELLLHPDHYVFRMLYSQGIALEDLGIGGGEADPRAAWRIFADNYHLFRATPSRMWLDWVFAKAFGIEVRLDAGTADHYFDTITEKLQQDDFRPRALFDRYGIEVLATTESPLDPLDHHRAIRGSGWGGRVITAYRPDPVVDPEFEGFADNLRAFGDLTGEDTLSWPGYLAAHRQRREYFAAMGATSTDHGHPTAATANLSDADAAALFERVKHGGASAADAELFRAQMLTEMAAMSVDDGLVMQIHPGSFRNHNHQLFAGFGRDMGADIPTRTDYVQALKPLLDRFGNEAELSIILFTLDEFIECGCPSAQQNGPHQGVKKQNKVDQPYRRAQIKTCRRGEHHQQGHPGFGQLIKGAELPIKSRSCRCGFHRHGVFPARATSIGSSSSCSTTPCVILSPAIRLAARRRAPTARWEVAINTRSGVGCT